MTGAGNDVINTDDLLTGRNENGEVTSSNNDTNDKLVIDGGNGTDIVTFGKDISEYTMTKNANGNIVITETAASDSNNDGKGDVTELRRVEFIKFADGTYDVAEQNFIPKASNSEVSTDEDTSVSLTINDFEYSDIEGDSLSAVQIVSLPTNGVLTLNGQSVSIGDEISANDINSGNLVFKPSSNSDTNTSFDFKVSDGKDWSENSATTTINVEAVADAPSITLSVTNTGEVVSSATNLVENGSFEDISGTDANGNSVSNHDIAYGGVAHNQSITGWHVITDEGSSAPTMEVHESHHANVGATDGHNYMDLGETHNNGDTDNNNTQIGQVISGIEVGELYTLKFDYFDKAALQESGANGEKSGVVEVYWGGEKIATIDGNNTTWANYKAQVEGGSGDGSNLLSFKEVGEGNDNWGMAIDNVSVVKTDMVKYDLDISSSLSDTDGSESLSITLSGIPTGATLNEGTLNSDGTWTINVDGNTFNGTVEMMIPKTVSDNFDIKATATATESSNGDISTATAIETAITNLVPTSEGEEKTIDFEGVLPENDDTTVVTPHATNVVIALDISGSMDDKVTLDDGTKVSRLQLAIDSLKEMIATYEDNGGVNVKLTTFDTDASATGWMSAEDALKALEGLHSGSATNYEDALFETYNTYTETPNGEKSVVYFISDGAPNRENWDSDGSGSYYQTYIDGQAVDNGYITKWTEFLKDNASELNVIGIGTGLDANDPDFQRIAVNIGTIKTNVLVVEDVTELKDTLVDNISAKVEGTVFDNVSGGDGAISIASITIEGVEYTKDNFPDSGVKMQSGSKLMFDFSTGNYTFTAIAGNYKVDTVESFKITAADVDGDTTSFDVNINVNVDDKASTPILTMDIKDAQVIENTANTFSDIAIHNNGGINLDDDYELPWYKNNDVNLNIDNINANKIETNDGDDNINIKYSASGKDIDLGNGNDTLVIGGSADRSEISMGDGNDIVQINGNFQGTTNSTGHIYLGSGDDKIQLHSGSNFDNGHIDGGGGNDTLYFTGSATEYKIFDSNNNLISDSNLTNMNSSGEYKIYRIDGNGTLQGAPLYVSKIENIVFEADQVTTRIYQYAITLSALLTDTDGSETLSNITLTDIPADATLQDSNGSVIGANADGSYTLQVDNNGDANVTLVSKTEVDSSDLEHITASVTSIENDSKDAITVHVTTEAKTIEGTEHTNDIKGTDADEHIDGKGGADVIHAGAGDDTIVFNGTEKSIDGGTGNDTLIMNNDTIDLEDILNHTEIKNIENIDLTNNHTQEMNINLDDILDITDENHELKIFGDSTDKVVLEGGDAKWSQQADYVSDTGETFHVYQGTVGGSNVKVLIDDDVSVTPDV